MKSGPILSYDEANKIAKEFIKLKKMAKKSSDAKIQKKFKEYQNYAANKLSYLVMIKANQYKQFSNYHDLIQDGFEALILALKTYKPSKGDFTWWARKYIETKISRAANAHSTIRYPLKKAKQTQPYKTAGLPVLIDSSATPSDAAEYNEIKKIVAKAISLLEEDQKKAITLYYEFSGNRTSTISGISEELNISRPTCIKLLEEAKSNLKNILNNVKW